MTLLAAGWQWVASHQQFVRTFDGKFVESITARLVAEVAGMNAYAGDIYGSKCVFCKADEHLGQHFYGCLYQTAVELMALRGTQRKSNVL